MSLDDDSTRLVGKFALSLGLAAGVYLLRHYIRGAQFTEKTRADGKVAVVTGANCGIGRATAQELNLRGVKVYLLCRSEERGEAARKEMIKAGCDPSRLIVRVVDLENFKTIRVFARMFRDEEPRLDILVNNAGVSGSFTFEQTVDGFEKTWQANYLGHFLLTDLLRPQLRQSKSARVINVSSMLHHNGDTVREEEVNKAENFKARKTYSRSKLAQVMHARWLTRLLRESDIQNVTVNACHPGAVNSNIYFRDHPFIKVLTAPLFWFIMKTEEDGAQTPLFLALSPKVEGLSGLYYRECSTQTPNHLASNDEECRILYETSKKAVAEER